MWKSLLCHDVFLFSLALSPYNWHPLTWPLIKQPHEHNEVWLNPCAAISKWLSEIKTKDPLILKTNVFLWKDWGLPATGYERLLFTKSNFSGEKYILYRTDNRCITWAGDIFVKTSLAWHPCMFEMGPQCGSLELPHGQWYQWPLRYCHYDICTDPCILYKNISRPFL